MSTARVLRCVIDSMILDAIAAEPEGLETVDRLTSAGRLELLAATETMAEIGRTPDPARRRALRRVRVLVVAPPDPRDPVAEALVAALLRTPGVGWEDARIAVTARRAEVPLVTEDRDLRMAVAACLPAVPVWSWAADLEPRIAALSAASPMLRRR